MGKIGSWLGGAPEYVLGGLLHKGTGTGTGPGFEGAPAPIGVAVARAAGSAKNG